MKHKSMTFKIDKEGNYILKKCVNVSGDICKKYTKKEVERLIISPIVEVIIK